MIDRSHALLLGRQAELMGISRRDVYCVHLALSDADQALMRCIDALSLEYPLEYPFAGSRMLRDLLARQGVHMGRWHVATLRRRIGMQALYRKPTRGRRSPGTKSIRTCCAV
jgi:putative transposase